MSICFGGDFSRRVTRGERLGEGSTAPPIDLAIWDGSPLVCTDGIFDEASGDGPFEFTSGLDRSVFPGTGGGSASSAGIAEEPTGDGPDGVGLITIPRVRIRSRTGPDRDTSSDGTAGASVPLNGLLLLVFSAVVFFSNGGSTGRDASGWLVGFSITDGFNALAELVDP